MLLRPFGPPGAAVSQEDQDQFNKILENSWNWEKDYSYPDFSRTESFPKLVLITSTNFAHDAGMITSNRGYIFEDHYYAKMYTQLQDKILAAAGWATATPAEREKIAYAWMFEINHPMTSQALTDPTPAFSIQGVPKFTAPAANSAKDGGVFVSYWTRHPPKRQPRTFYQRHCYYFEPSGHFAGNVEQACPSFATDFSDTQLEVPPMRQDGTPYQEGSSDGDVPASQLPKAPIFDEPSPPPPPLTKEQKFSGALPHLEFYSPEERAQIMEKLKSNYKFYAISQQVEDEEIEPMRCRTELCLLVKLPSYDAIVPSRVAMMYKDEYSDSAYDSSRGGEILRAHGWSENMNESERLKLMLSFTDEIEGGCHELPFLTEPHPAFSLPGAPKFDPHTIVMRKKYPTIWIHRWIFRDSSYGRAGFLRICYGFDKESGNYQGVWWDRGVSFWLNEDKTAIEEGPYWDNDSSHPPYTGEDSWPGLKDDVPE